MQGQSTTSQTTQRQEAGALQQPEQSAADSHHQHQQQCNESYQVAAAASALSDANQNLLSQFISEASIINRTGDSGCERAASDAVHSTWNTVSDKEALLKNTATMMSIESSEDRALIEGLVREQQANYNQMGRQLLISQHQKTSKHLQQSQQQYQHLQRRKQSFGVVAYQTAANDKATTLEQRSWQPAVQDSYDDQAYAEEKKQMAVLSRNDGEMLQNKSQTAVERKIAEKAATQHDLVIVSRLSGANNNRNRQSQNMLIQTQSTGARGGGGLQAQQLGHHLTTQSSIQMIDNFSSTDDQFHYALLQQEGPLHQYQGNNGGSCNLEDTTQLMQQMVADVDLDKISRERNDKLQAILNSNIQARKNEFNMAEGTYRTQNDRVGQIQAHLSQVTEQLNILTQQCEERQSLMEQKQKTLAHSKTELEAKAAQEKAQMTAFLQKSTERRVRLEKERQEMSKIVQEQQSIRESLKGRIAALQARETQLLDSEISQLQHEDRKLVEQIEVLANAVATLSAFIQQSSEQSCMLEEDLQGSACLEQQLVSQREELENYMDQLKAKMTTGCIWSEQLQSAYEGAVLQASDANHRQTLDEVILSHIVHIQSKKLVVDLVRELQQYMLSHASGTTDQSTQQSQALEEIEIDVTSGRTSVEKAMESIISFSSTNFNLELSHEQLDLKIQSIKNGVNLDRVKVQLRSIQSLNNQTNLIQASISTVQRRVHNELLPASTAIQQTRHALNLEKDKTSEAINALQVQHEEIQILVSQVRQTFVAKPTGQQLQSKIKELAKEVQTLTESVQQKEYQMESITGEISLANEEIYNMQAKMDGLAETTRIQCDQIQGQLLNLLKQEENIESQQDLLQISQLHELKEKLRYELESAQNRLKYAQQKVQQSQESLFHAEGVLQDKTPEQDERKGPKVEKDSQQLIATDNEYSTLPSQTRQSATASAYLGELDQRQTGTITPGLLTSIVRQVRRSTRTQNRVDLAELLRQSVSLSIQGGSTVEQASSSYQQLSGLEKGKAGGNTHQRGLNRAQTQIEPTLAESVVDTERLLAGRKDKTLRYNQFSNSQVKLHQPLQYQKTAYNSNSHSMLGDVKASQSQTRPQHHRTITPALTVTDLDRSGSLANFQSAEPPFRNSSQTTQQQAKKGVSVSNFRNTSANHNQQQEEQGCQMLTTSASNPQLSQLQQQQQPHTQPPQAHTNDSPGDAQPHLPNRAFPPRGPIEHLALNLSSEMAQRQIQVPDASLLTMSRTPDISQLAADQSKAKYDSMVRNQNEDLAEVNVDSGAKHLARKPITHRKVNLTEAIRKEDRESPRMFTKREGSSERYMTKHSESATRRDAKEKKMVQVQSQKASLGNKYYVDCLAKSSNSQQHTQQQQQSTAAQQKLQPTNSSKTRSHQQSLINVPSHSASISSFNLKRLSQATTQSMNLIGQQNELFNQSQLHSLHREGKQGTIHRSLAQLHKGNSMNNSQSTVTAPTISSSSKTKVQRRSMQRNQNQQKYRSTGSSQQLKETANGAGLPSAASSQRTATQQQKTGGGGHVRNKRSLDGIKMQMLSASSRSGLLNQSNSMVLAATHAKSLTQFKQMSSYPKKLTLTMNKVSNRPANSLQKGVVVVNDQKTEEFFKSIRPLVSGAKFFIAMDSGSQVEQIVYLNLDLLTLHIESATQSTCEEVIQVKQLYKTELPPTTLEQIRIYQRSPEEVAKAARPQLYDFNLHVLEQVLTGSGSQQLTNQAQQTSSLLLSTIQQHSSADTSFVRASDNTSNLAIPSSLRTSAMFIKPATAGATTPDILQGKKQQQQHRFGSSSSQPQLKTVTPKSHHQYRVKLAATSYDQLKEWIVGINHLIKEKANLSRYASLAKISNF